jgi:hypothetical protein
MTKNTLSPTETPSISKTHSAIEKKEDYLKRIFTIGKKERDVKFCVVGKNTYRINFFQKDNPNNIFSGSFISRSYYVKLIKNNNSWSHKIL